MHPLCAGNKVFVKYPAQVQPPNHPLAYALVQETGMNVRYIQSLMLLFQS